MPNQPKTPARSVRVGVDLWEAAKAKAAKRGETVTDVVVRALEQYVRRPVAVRIVRKGEDPELDAIFVPMMQHDALRWEVHQWTGNDPDYCARCLVEWEDADSTCEDADKRGARD